MNRNFISIALVAIIGATAIKENNTNFFSDTTGNNSYTQATKKIIKIYPNPSNNGSVTVTSNMPDNEFHFFVFDIEGTLINQKILKGKKPHTIQNLRKGIYMYDVFEKDISIEQGRIIVK